MYNNNQTHTQIPSYMQYQTVSRPTYQSMPYMGIKGRPVASIEEARASIIDFDGSIFYFPDLANKRIYTKQINMDGSAQLNMYELKEIPAEIPINSAGAQYVTRQEFEEAIRQLQLLTSAPQSVPEAPAAKPVEQPAVTLNF